MVGASPDVGRRSQQLERQSLLDARVPLVNRGLARFKEMVSSVARDSAQASACATRVKRRQTPATGTGSYHRATQHIGRGTRRVVGDISERAVIENSRAGAKYRLPVIGIPRQCGDFAPQSLVSACSLNGVFSGIVSDLPLTSRSG